MYEIFENKLFLKEIMNMCLLVISEIFGQFINTMINNPILIKRIYHNQIKCNYLKNKKVNLSFSFAPSHFL